MYGRRLPEHISSPVFPDKDEMKNSLQDRGGTEARERLMNTDRHWGCAAVVGGAVGIGANLHGNAGGSPAVIVDEPAIYAKGNGIEVDLRESVNKGTLCKTSAKANTRRDRKDRGEQKSPSKHVQS